MTETATGQTPAVEAASRLRRAYSEGIACAPVRDLIGNDDIQAAYAVQQLLTAERVAGGARVVGRKIGLTSEAVRAQMGVDQPDLGVLFDDMEYLGGQEIPGDLLIQPRAEGEIAFVLGADLVEGDLDAAQVRDSVTYAVAALEICDSRICDWDISFGDTVADNASAGVYVLGPARQTLRDFDPRAATMTMHVDGVLRSTGTGEACLGDPLIAVSWLARQARDLGDPLRAGQVVLSGALGPMVAVGPNQSVTANITGLGAVTTRFGNATTTRSQA
jgi:2-keto-4-pentenoate hydratase